MSQIAAAGAAGAKNPREDGSTWANKPHVAAALAKARSLSIEATGMTREKLTEMLMDAYRNASTAAEQIMAAKELGKLHGLYAAQKLEVGHTHKLEAAKSEREIKALTSEELLRLAHMRPGAIIEGEFEEIRLPKLVERGSQG